MLKLLKTNYDYPDLTVATTPELLHASTYDDFMQLIIRRVKDKLIRIKNAVALLLDDRNIGLFKEVKYEIEIICTAIETDDLYARVHFGVKPSLPRVDYKKIVQLFCTAIFVNGNQLLQLDTIPMN